MFKVTRKQKIKAKFVGLTELNFYEAFNFQKIVRDDFFERLMGDKRVNKKNFIELKEREKRIEL